MARMAAQAPQRISAFSFGGSYVLARSVATNYPPRSIPPRRARACRDARAGKIRNGRSCQRRCPRASTVMISGLFAVNPEHNNSTAGRVAQGSSGCRARAAGPCISRNSAARRALDRRTVALAHHPVDPLQEHVLRHVLAEADPARHIAEHAGERHADEIQHRIDAVSLGRGHQLPVAGLRRDEQRARHLGLFGSSPKRLAAEGMADIGERQRA